MAMQQPKPKLSLGNHIYLYQLLSSALGCGRQTLMPRVEEVLEAERMGAADLGFESTRELLEALDDFIDLTVFKGGRVYATIVAQPAWDEALAQTAKQQKPAGGKPWKRKSADKGLKPVKPRRVKRPEPEPKPEPEHEEEAPATAPSDGHIAPDPAIARKTEPADGAQAPRTDPNTDPAKADLPAPDPEATAAEAELSGSMGDAADKPASPREPGSADAAAVEPDAADAASDTGETGAAGEAGQAPRPSISLTVVYDPEHANAGMTTLESTPGIALADIGVDDGTAPVEGHIAAAAPVPAAAESSADNSASPAAAAAPDVPLGAAGSARAKAPAPAAAAEPATETEPSATDDAADAAGEASPRDAAGAPVVRPAQRRPRAARRHTPAEKARGAAAGPDRPAAHTAQAETEPTPARPAATPSAQAAPDKPACAETDATRQAEIPAGRPRRTPEPQLPAGYPQDLTRDAFCPGGLLTEISYLLPFGADVMGILNEYYHIALLRGSLECARNRASFPMGFSRDGERAYATVAIRRNTQSQGAPWLIDSCTVDGRPQGE